MGNLHARFDEGLSPPQLHVASVLATVEEGRRELVLEMMTI